MTPPKATGVAFIGCGYVADFYLATLAHHPEISLRGVHASDAERSRKFSHDMDFSRGIADMAQAVRRGVSPRLTARHALHVLEITLAIASPEGAAHTVLRTGFDELEPMAWAEPAVEPAGARSARGSAGLPYGFPVSGARCTGGLYDGVSVARRRPVVPKAR